MKLSTAKQGNKRVKKIARRAKGRVARASRKANRGITLIEIMIIAVILGILLAIAGSACSGKYGAPRDLICNGENRGAVFSNYPTEGSWRMQDGSYYTQQMGEICRATKPQ